MPEYDNETGQDSARRAPIRPQAQDTGHRPLFRKFLVRLPSGDRYWTVVGKRFCTVADVDDWLLHLRMGRGCAESTTEAYATSLALFLSWCQLVGLDLRETPSEFGRFGLWLRHFDPNSRVGAPRRVVRGAARINAVTAAVREFFKHAAAIGLVDKDVVDALYDVVEVYDFSVEDVGRPVEVRGDRRGARLRARPRHRLPEPDTVVDPASDEEVLELLRACRNPRDRFIVLALWRAGTRRGELTGARMEDVHFLPDSSRLGCRVKGPHLHVRRRENNVNGATAKSRRTRAVPVDWLVVQAYDQYMLVRNANPLARRCDYLLVNLFSGQIGHPMKPRALNELFATLSRRAGLAREMHPHLLRHAFGTNLAASGSKLDEIKVLLGHASVRSSLVYLHPSPERLRDAIERVGSPRLSLAEGSR